MEHPDALHHQVVFDFSRHARQSATDAQARGIDDETVTFPLHRDL
jgi:hypothetical protein